MTSFSTGGIEVQETWEPLSYTLHINMHVDVYMFCFESELPKLVVLTKVFATIEESQGTA